jgi:hypothetical protein
MRALALCLAALFMPLIAQAETDPREEIVRALAAKPVRADLVVVFDTSGSMAKHFEAARKFVGDLADVAGPDDTITFIGFAERASDLMPPVTVRAGGAERLRARLAKLNTPRGRYSDLSEGLESVLDALVRPNYAPVSMVFLITDFCSEPPPKSASTGKPESRSSACQKPTMTESLKKKSTRLFGANDQSVRVFALALEPTSEAGVALARNALGSVVRVEVERGDLSRALEGVRARMAYDRAALAIEQMLKRPPIEIVPPRDPLPVQGKNVIDFGLVSNAPFAMSVRVREARVLDASVRLEPAEEAMRIDLPPRSEGGTPVTVALPLRTERSRTDQLFPLKRSTDVELSFDVELLPAGPIEKLLAAPPRGSGLVRERLQLAFAPPDPTIQPIAATLMRGAERLALAPGEEREVTLAVRSLIAWGDLELGCALGERVLEPIRLTPTSTATVHATIKNEANARAWWIEHDRTQEAKIEGTCEVVAVANDGTRFPHGRHPLTASTTLMWREGLPLPWVLGAFFAIIAAVLIYIGEIKPRASPAALAGRLVVYAGPGKFRQVAIPLRGRARIALLGSAAKEAEVRLDGDRIVLPGLEGTAAELYAEKIGKRNIMRLRKLKGEQVTVDAEQLEAAPVVVRRGRGKFALGEYRLRIE